MPAQSVLDWLGSGYVRLWERIHRAEEALILVVPLENAIAGALNDELRLQGSNIENRDALIARLREAVGVLVARAGLLLRPPPPAAGAGPNPPAYAPADEMLARELLRQVRRAINEFRDERHLGLVRARNQLMRTVFVTGLVCFALLALAVVVGAPPHTLIAAASFYLLGAGIGLFNRLSLDASAETAVEDYGLSTARLMHTPLFSGLAALGGVLVVPMLSVLINPVGSTTDAAASGQQIIAPSLVNIFDLNKRPFGLVIAAIFGLSPRTLISRLQQGFDFKFQPSIDPKIIRELATGRYIESGDNILLLGPPGVGKSHLAVALGLKACEQGYRTLFTTAAGLITTLGKALAENRLEEKLKILAQPQVLIIDEIGYIPIDRQGASLFFQLVSRRYERGAIILTSNQSLGAWGEVFGDSVTTPRSPPSVGLSRPALSFSRSR